MFLWKNAIVLIALLGVATLPATMLVRAGWEKRYIARLMICGALIVCLAVSFVPMLATQLGFGLLLICCFDKRVPMAATYLFFLLWTPAAGSLLAIAGAYIAPITPFMSFAGALLVGYLLHPEHHLRRRFMMSDAAMLAFLLIYCTCVSLRNTPTGIARNVATYVLPYLLSYHLLSRVRIERPELVLRLLLFGAATAGLLCLFESVRHWPLYAGIWAIKRDLWTIDAPRVWLERGGVPRAYGPFAHPLTGGAMLGLSAIGAWALLVMRGRSVPLLALGGLVLLGLAATLSRSGLVALGIGIMTFQILRGRYWIAGLVALAGLLIVVGAPVLGGEDAQLSASYRLEILTGIPRALGSGVWFGYREAVEMGLLDAFIQGQGIVDLVNAYLAIIVQGGIVSLIPYLLFLLTTYPHYRAIRRSRPDPETLLLAQALIAIQTATIVALALLGAWVAPMQLSFLVVAMLIALRVDRRRPRSGEAARPAPSVDRSAVELPGVAPDRLPALP